MALSNITNTRADKAEEEDDYLTMTFDDPSTTTKTETLTQRKKRLAREAEERSRTKSKAQILEEERAKRNAALNTTSMDTSNKGFKMMQRLGYKPGTALGVDRMPQAAEDSDKKPKDERLLEPVGLEIREGRGGIGADAEKKRKFREAVERIEGAEKRQKVEEGDFRERQMREREEKKVEGQMWGAMKVAERLEEEDEENPGQTEGQSNTVKQQSKSLPKINVLWRQLVKERLIKERDRRMRYDLHQSLSKQPTYDDPEEEAEDKIAMGRKQRLEEVDLELDHDDPELESFEALPVDERLSKLVSHLRERWSYCFWCKFRYPDETMEGCPGLSEEEHD